MVSKKGGKFIAAIVTIFSFIAIGWFSCTKIGAQLSTCNGVLCYNGGYCLVDTFTKKPKCHCPTGFEGPGCATGSVDRFIGTWNMMQITTGSDSMKYDTAHNKILDTVNYLVMLKKTATPTTFFLDNFRGNPYYNGIICMLDSNDGKNFVIDTLPTHHLLFDHFKLVSGNGFISVNDSVIKANLITRHLSVSSNWVNDTFVLIMTRHNP